MQDDSLMGHPASLFKLYILCNNFCAVTVAISYADLGSSQIASSIPKIVGISSHKGQAMGSWQGNFVMISGPPLWRITSSSILAASIPSAS